MERPEEASYTSCGSVPARLHCNFLTRNHLMNNKQSLPLGSLGEQKAREFLEQKKQFHFIDRNFRTKWGELDLIGELPDETVLFVEVKSRFVSELDVPLEHIDSTKLTHLRKAIDIYLDAKNWQDRNCRLDGIGIEFELTSLDGEPRVITIEHVEDLTGW